MSIFNLLEGNYTHNVYMSYDDKYYVSILKDKSTFDFLKVIQSYDDDDDDDEDYDEDYDEDDDEDDEDEQIDRKKRVSKDDGSSSLIDAVRSDYAKTIFKCKKLIIKYLKDVSEPVHKIIDSFQQLMESIHPFFSEEVDYGDYCPQKITPAKALLVEQLHYELLEMYKKHPFNIEEKVEAKVLPVMTSILKIDNELRELTESINIFQEIVAGECTVNNSLLYLNNFLDSVKVFLYLMSTPLYEKMSMSSNSVMEQFIDTVNNDPYKTFLPVTRQGYDRYTNLYNYMDLKDFVLNGQIDNFIKKADQIYDIYKYDYGEYFTISSFQEAAYLQMFVIVQNNSPVKICQYCNKVFIPKAPQSKYCQYVFDLNTGDRCCDMVIKDKNDFWHTSEVFKRKRRIDGRFDSRLRYAKEAEKNLIYGFIQEWRSVTRNIKKNFMDELISEDEAISHMESQYAYYVEKIKSFKKKIP